MKKVIQSERDKEGDSDNEEGAEREGNEIVKAREIKRRRSYWKNDRREGRDGERWIERWIERERERERECVCERETIIRLLGRDGDLKWIYI